MNRLQAIVMQDFRLQKRYGFYYAAIVATIMWVAVLVWLPDDLKATAVPLVIFSDLGTIGFFFIAGLVLFEKNEQTLLALIISPLRFWEYLAAKLGTLTLLALVTSLVVTLIIYGTGLNWFLLIAGTIFTSVICMLVGFIAVSRFRNISEYLLPAQVYLIPLGLPLLYFVGWLKSPLIYLIPTQGSLLMLGGAFTGIGAVELAYALIYQIIWVGILSWWARGAYDKYIVARQAT